MRLGLMWSGDALTKAPQPLSSIPTPNKMGTLNVGVGSPLYNTASDNLACNALHSQYNCPKTLPTNGVLYNDWHYNLSTFFSFTLPATASLTFTATNNYSSPSNLMRLYKQTLTGNCANLDTVNLLATLSQTGTVSCLAPGNYVLQVMGVDSVVDFKLQGYSYNSISNSTTTNIHIFYNLGSNIDLTIGAKSEVATNLFSLSAAGKFDKINAVAGVMQPLKPNTLYTAIPDTFGCANTVMPEAEVCKSSEQNLTKASYRQFKVADSFILEMYSYYPLQTKLYKGDANALATAQGAFTYPKVITGLIPYTKCIPWNGNKQYACIIPGNYSLISYDNEMGKVVTLDITPKSTQTKYGNPAKAQDMGDLWALVNSLGNPIASAVDTFTCRDNPVIIDGLAPCNLGEIPRNKLIYRQFYLSSPAIININNNYLTRAGVLSLFKGKASDGILTLKSMGDKWTCFTDQSSTDQCDALSVGWYTVVSYGYGPTFIDPLQNSQDQQYSDVGLPNQLFITLTSACASPQFNRPYKASVDTITKKPYLIEWGPQTGHTPEYPVTSKKYTLNTEHFNCTQDTAFISKYINSCDVGNVKVAFYTFKTTQESYIQMDGIDANLWGTLYAFDVRTADSIKLKISSPLQPCLNVQGQMEFCKLQAGTYTLVFFAPVSYTCNTVTPTIYIDQVGYSRFDHAAKAYDFGAVVPDSIWHNGKTGDINPLNSGRAPSNDFFYCTTGAQSKDPVDAVCLVKYNPEIYNTGNNVVLHPDNTTAPVASEIDRRNLWYTFTIRQPGRVRVKVQNKSPDKIALNPYAYINPFAIFKSDVDGSLPFNQVVNNGLVDSTLAQGLTHIINSLRRSSYCESVDEIDFFVEPCNFTPTRYYILVENRNPYGYADVHVMNPNSQVEVSVLLDSVTYNPPKFDHFSQANDMGLVNNGKKKGVTDNYTCATKDLSDPLYSSSSCQKTLWYKFTTTTSGQIRYTSFFQNINNYDYQNIQLFRQVKPNDSSANGLQYMPYSTTFNDNGTWAQQCIAPGTYYIILPGCNAVNEDVYPEIEIIPQAGDFCSAPMITSLNGAGSSLATVTVDCHTIGTDYGEFNQTLTCPDGAITSNYKTSWFRIDITGNDTLDVTVYIDEKTNAGSTDIKYRMMTGNCGAMQEQSCVQDALTRNTYKCLAPKNSYYIQVFSPIIVVNTGQPVTGDIDLNISSVKHADTCLPANNCIGVANFTPQFDCTTDKNVTFTNISTYGSSIKYDWDFGYNNQISNAVSPQFFYPALTVSKTYTAKLLLTNTSCGKKDSVTQTITIPARPSVNLGADTLICASTATVALNATSYPGSTYSWYNGSDQPNQTFNSSANAWVEVTYKNCKARDTINIWINPIVKLSLQTIALCTADQVILSANRGYGEQFSWSNNALTNSISVSQPGYYWCDIYLNGCITRDSFLVVSNTLNTLSDDTTICFSLGTYNVDAALNGAVSYLWDDASSSPLRSISAPGIYWVDIGFGNCIVRDSLTVSDFPPPLNRSIDASICAGQNFKLPWGTTVSTADIYKDTTRYASGCDSLIQTVNLSVLPVPVLGANQSINICLGGVVDLTKLYNTTGITVVWTFAGVPVATPSLANAAGVYRLVASNSAGCADTALVTISIDMKPTIGPDKAAGICPGNSFDLTPQFITTGLNSNWSLAGTSVTTPASVTIAGIYQLIASNSTGCSDTALLTLTLNPKPDLGADKTLSICSGGTAELTTQFITTGLTASWSFGGTAVSNPIAVSAQGIYQLIASNSSGCADTALVTVTFDNNPALGADKVVNLCSGNTADITSLYNTAGLTSNWSSGGVAITPPTAVATPGIFQLIAINSSGCADTVQVTVNISSKLDIGADKTVSICPGSSTDLTSAFVLAGLTANWTLNGVAVPVPSAITSPGVYQLIASNGTSCSDTAFVTVSVNSKTDLGADKTASICSGNSFDLTKQFITTGLTTDWSVSGVPVIDPASITIAGVYQLIASNASGCSDTALLNLTVNLKPDLGTDKALSICPGGTANLAAQFITTGLATSWTADGMAVSNPAVVSAATGYQLIAIGGSGCSDTALVTITFDTKPTLGNDKTANLCAGSAADLTSLYNTSNLTTSWALGGVIIVPPIAIATAGIYQLIAINSAGCADTAQVTVNVTAIFNIGADKSVGICQGSVEDLTTEYVLAGLTADWTLNGVPETNPKAITVPGVYQLIVSNGSTCTDTALVTVTINVKPDVGTDQTRSICSGSSFDLTTLFVTNGLNTSWSLAGITVPMPTSVNQPGIYQLIAADASSCSDTALLTLTLNPKPDLGADKTLSICSGGTAELTTQFITTGLTASWSFGGTAVSNPIAVSAQGIYQLIGSNSSGCADTALVTVTFDNNPALGADKAVNLCSGNAADLTSLYNTAGLTSNWSSGGVAITPPAAVATPGIFQLIAINSSGCADTVQVTVNISSKLDIGADKTVSICPGSSTDLTSAFVLAGLTANWTLNGVAVPVPSAITSPGVYQLIASNGTSCSDTAFVTVSVNSKTDLGADKTASICSGNSFDLTKQFITTGLTTDWSVSGVPVIDPASITIAGVYQLIASNASGCSDTALLNLTVNLKPDLGTDKALSICPGGAANLAAQFITTGLATSWTADGMAVSNPAVVSAATGYQLIAIGGSGCSDTALVTITFDTKPALGEDKTVSSCPGNAVDLSNQFVTAGLTTSWSIGGELVTVPEAVSNAGIYSLIASNSFGCKDTGIVIITMNSKPDLGPDKTLNVCIGKTFVLVSQFNTTGLTSFWSLNGNTVSNPLSVTTAGIYQLIATNSFGCPDTVLATLIIVPNPTVIINNPATLCEPNRADLTLASVTAGSSLGLSFTYWKDITATVLFNTPTTAETGNYFIKGTDATGCFTIEPVSVLINPVITVNAGKDTAICNNTSALLHGTVSNAAGPVTYLWSPADGLDRTDAATTVANPGTTILYTLTVKDDYGCNFTVTDNILVTMQPPVSAFAGNDTNAVIGLPQQLQASGGVQYLWSPAYPLNNPFISNPLAVLNMDTRFAVEVKDAIGCVGYDTVSVKVYEGITYYIPNAFSPNGDGLNDIFKPTPVGIVSTSYFRILNRYGEIVFETNQWNKGWNGTSKGVPQQIGNYVWVIKGTGRNGKVVEMKGNVLLVR